MLQLYLMVQRSTQPEHSSHVVKVLRLHANTSSPDIYLRKQPNWRTHLELCHRNTGNPGKSAKLDHVIQLNCGKVCTHADYKTTRTWENCNNQGTKMILLLDKLGLTANNSKNFANGSKLIIRNNLGLCKRSEIYLI